jgi:superkiller protein 3
MGQKAGKRITDQGKKERKHRKLRTVTARLLLGMTALFLVIVGIRFLTDRKTIQQLPALPVLAENSGKLKAALVEADRNGRAWPLRGNRVGGLAMIYHANFFYPQAKACYRTAMKLQPKNPRWPYYLADINEKMGESEEARVLLEKTIAVDPGYDPARLKLANAYFKAGRLEEAESAFQNLLENTDAAPYALLGLGRIAVSRRDWAKAEDYLERAIAGVPRFGVALRLLATVYSRTGRPEQAALAQDRATYEDFYELADPWIEELDPYGYNVAGLLRLATDALRRQNRQRAYKLCERALFVEPDNAENTMSVAMVLYNSQSRSVSLPVFRKVTLLDPNNEDAYFHIAAMYVESNQLETAETVFRRILEFNPRSTWALVGLGDVRFRRREIEPAAEFYQKARELDPRSARVLYSLGTIEYERKNRQQAIRYLDEALKIDERYVDAHLTLGTILSEMDELDRAAAHFRRIIEISPFLAMGRYNLGNVFYRQGKFADAIYQFGRAIEIDPEFADAYLNLGAALKKSGKTEEARDRFRKALDLARKAGNRDLENIIQENLTADSSRGDGS